MTTSGWGSAAARARLWLASAAGFIGALAAGLAAAVEVAQPAYEVDGRRSGYTYLSQETRTLQDDPYLNP